MLKNLQDGNDNNIVNENNYIVGENVITVWKEFQSEQLAWYLGIVDEILPHGKVEISYFEPCDKMLKKWMLPGDSKYLTDQRQVKLKHVKVCYSLGKTIRCTLDEELLA